MTGVPGTAQAVTAQAVRDAIATVVDPCSRLHGTDLSLVDLGMVEDVHVSGGAVRVDLLLDDPLCTYTFVLQHELRAAVAALAGVESVEVTVIPDASWSAERVTPAARSRLLGERLARRLPLRPAQPDRVSS